MKQKIVILGAGFGGIYVLKRLHKIFHKNPDIELVLINRKNYFLFTPLLHEVATGAQSPGNIVEPLRKAMGCCLADLYVSDVKNICTKEKYIETGSSRITYDILVIALGSESNFYNTPGAKEYTFTLKTLEGALRLKKHCIEQFERASKTQDEKIRKKLLSFAIIGGGPTGVELAAEMADFFYGELSKYHHQTNFKPSIEITLIQKQAELLSHCSKKFQRKSQEILKRKRVKIILQSKVQRVEKDRIIFENQESIEAETIVWVAGIKPASVEIDTEKNEKGQLIVNQFLQLQGKNNVFAIGDIAKNVELANAPATAQAATKQAKCVAKNIEAIMKGKNLRPFIFRNSGYLVSLGKWNALAEIYGIFFSGHFAWWLWRTIYLLKLISKSKKLKVAVDWTLQLFSPRDISAW